jgi:hypothetical protein
MNNTFFRRRIKKVPANGDERHFTWEGALVIATTLMFLAYTFGPVFLPPR